MDTQELPIQPVQTATDIAVIKSEVTNMKGLMSEIRNDIKTMNGSFITAQVFADYRKEVDSRMLETVNKSSFNPVRAICFGLVGLLGSAIVVALVSSILK